MKKQLLTGALLLASFFAVQAQDIINTDFGTDQATFTTAFTGWDNIAFEQDGDFWGPSLNDPAATGLGFSGVSFFSASFENTGTEEAPVLSPLNPFNVLVSPAIDLTTAENAFTRVKLGNFGADDAVMGYQVLVITAEDYAAEDYTQVVIAGEGTIAPNSAETVTVNLDEFVGQSVHIWYAHNGEATQGVGYLILDDVVIAEGVAGVKENLIAKLTVSPNPASDVINIANNDNILVNNVAVLDINGRTVKTANFAGVTEAQLNLSDLSAGVYMMTISSDKGSVTKKIVKN